jgi:hypothetical protein
MDDYFINVDLNTEEGKASYVSEISRIKNSSQSADSKLNLLDLLVRDFLRKRFHIKRTAEYSEMIDFFLQKSKPHVAVFCHAMLNQLYSGDSIDQNSISLLLEDAKTMIEKELYGVSLKEKKPGNGIFSKLFGPRDKKQALEKTSPDHVGKQTEKIIEKALLPEQEMKVEVNTENREIKNSRNLVDSLRTELSLSMSPEQLVNVQPGSNKEQDAIQSIDDLDRIKKKIRYKKIAVAAEMQEKQKSENPEQEQEPEEAS